MVLHFLGRLLFAALFLGCAFDKFASYEPIFGGGTGVYMAPKMDHFLNQVQVLTGQEIPEPILATIKSHYPTLVLVAGTLEVGGALLLLLNSKMGSAVLLAFVLPVTLIIHNFWDLTDDKERTRETVQFLKNLALMGALLIHLGTSKPLKRTGQAGKAKRS